MVFISTVPKNVRKFVGIDGKHGTATGENLRFTVSIVDTLTRPSNILKPTHMLFGHLLANFERKQGGFPSCNNIFDTHQWNKV